MEPAERDAPLPTNSDTRDGRERDHRLPHAAVVAAASTSAASAASTPPRRSSRAAVIDDAVAPDGAKNFERAGRSRSQVSEEMCRGVRKPQLSQRARGAPADGNTICRQIERATRLQRVRRTTHSLAHVPHAAVVAAVVAAAFAARHRRRVARRSRWRKSISGGALARAQLSARRGARARALRGDNVRHGAAAVLSSTSPRSTCTRRTRTASRTASRQLQPEARRRGARRARGGRRALRPPRRRVHAVHEARHGRPGGGRAARVDALRRRRAARLAARRRAARVARRRPRAGGGARGARAGRRRLLRRRRRAALPAVPAPARDDRGGRGRRRRGRRQHRRRRRGRRRRRRRRRRFGAARRRAELAQYSGEGHDYPYHVPLGRIPTAVWAHWGPGTYVGGDFYSTATGALRRSRGRRRCGARGGCASATRRAPRGCSSTAARGGAPRSAGAWRASSATRAARATDGSILEWAVFSPRAAAHRLEVGWHDAESAPAGVCACCQPHPRPSMPRPSACVECVPVGTA